MRVVIEGRILGALGLEPAQGIKSLTELLLRGVAKAVEAADRGLVDKDVSAAGEDAMLELVGGEPFAAGLPHFGIEPAVTAEHPFAMDKDIDEGALVGVGGIPAQRVLGFELFDG